MLPQNPPVVKTNKTKAPRAAAPAAACVAGRSRGQHMLPQQALKTNGNSAPPHKTKNPSCCRSCGGMRGWPDHRPTHAPATALSPNGNSAPPTKPKTPRAVTLWRHACLTTPVVNTSLLQIPSAQTTTTPKTIVIPESPPQGGLASSSERMRSAASQDTPRGAIPAQIWEFEGIKFSYPEE